jgi:hypothetical protein
MLKYHTFCGAVGYADDLLLLVGYVMGYQSVGIQFVWSVLQNLMHKLPGNTFIFFLG